MCSCMITKIKDKFLAFDFYFFFFLFPLAILFSLLKVSYIIFVRNWIVLPLKTHVHLQHPQETGVILWAVRALPGSSPPYPFSPYFCVSCCGEENDEPRRLQGGKKRVAE